MKKYTNPEAHGFIMEAKACQKIENDLCRLIGKYSKAIEREEAARQKDFEAAMEYRNEGDIQEAYGWELITEKQYRLYLQIFHEGQDELKNHPKTVNEITHSILCHMLHDIERDRRQWEFEALSPEEQMAERKRAAESQKKWKAYISELKRKRGIIEYIE